MENVGVVSGVAAGTGSSKAVIVAGLAEAFAGALSMGAGEFIAGRSEAQVQVSEVQKELHEVRTEPRYELNEMAALLQAEGLDPVDAQMIAENPGPLSARVRKNHGRERTGSAV